jgi:hypothetical protein
MSDISNAQSPSERAAKQITLLLPVWGYQFVGRFLEFCLPTLLAPNNIPAIAQALPCRFILLSSTTDKAVIQSHPAWQALERLCRAEIQSIDDLITQANHTATITLAFERALRQSANALRDTCFIFLMSDYLVADGSLKTVLETVQKGAGAVLAGNFQIIAEDVVPLLRRQVDRAAQEIVLQPRELLQWSLAHLHPATIANIVNFGLTHNAYANRLFWRVDENSLIGRFYLMHPIAIHPEVADFAVEASWDYSFVPELCPSGNIVPLTDSDDYLVVELQRREYEWENLRPGPIVPAALARSLAEWTTEHHRRNVAQPVLFHAAGRPANLAQYVAQSDAFVDGVSKLLAAPPLHHQRHPYWIGSIAVNRYRGHRPLGREDWSFLLGERTSRPNAALRWLQAKVFGVPPTLTSLHPLWPDYKLPLKALNEVSASNGRALLVTHDAEPFAQWVVATASNVVTLSFDHLLQLSADHYGGLAGSFDACLLLANERMLERADALIEHIGPLLKAGGRIVLMVANSLAAEDAFAFGRNFAAHAGRLLNRSMWLEDIQYVEMSPRRLAIRSAMMRVVAWSGQMQFLLPAALPVALANHFANLSARTLSTPPPGAWSSVCLTLRASEQAAPYPLRFAQDAVPDRNGPAVPPPADDQPTPAAPAGRLWQDDAAQSASHLAHYRFISALLGVRNDVAEYGCVSPSGTRLASEQFRKLTLFDPRAFVVSDLQWRFQDNWRLEARQHDILLEPLPRQVDSIYCVDFIKYISPDEEDAFVRNFRDSLSRDFDFLLIGSPSYGKLGSLAAHPAAQSDQHDFPCRSTARQSGPAGRLQQAVGLTAANSRFAQSEARVYWRTGAELKALMERHFQNAFVFSMVDDVARPGIEPDAQHVFAMASGKKA